MRFGFREFVFVLLLLAMPVAAYFFVFQPRNIEIAQAREEIRQKQMKLKQLEAATKDIADLGDEIARLTQAIELFEQKLPEQREVEVVLGQVWELANKQQLTPKNIRTDRPVATAQYTELPIKMVIVGSFDGFYKFLLEIEKLPRITRLTKLQLKKLDEGGEMQADVVLSIFFEGTGDSGNSGGKTSKGSKS
jgi:type IV pilus assembly protein PilO